MQVNFGGLYFGTEDKATGRYTEYGGTAGKLDPKVPWTNVKVRQAMNKAINRPELLRVIYKGRATPMYVHSAGLSCWHRGHFMSTPTRRARLRSADDSLSAGEGQMTSTSSHDGKLRGVDGWGLASFGELIRPQQSRWRDREAEGLGGLEPCTKPFSFHIW